MNAYILTVGDEILIGQITDTNSAWMAQQLNIQGIRIVGKASVGDDATEITLALDHALTKADLVLMTGGLGATKDDITKKSIADYLRTDMIWHQETYDRMSFFFKKLGREVSEMNKKSCYMPACAVILNNDRGLAPGMWFEISPKKIGGTSFAEKLFATDKKKILVSLPGVPHEMQHLMTDRVLPRLKSSFPISPIVHRTVLTAGEGETMLAEKLMMFEDSLPDNIKLAYLPSLGTVRLRLTGKGNDEAELIQEVEAYKTKMVEIVKNTVAGYEEDTMPILIGRMLKERGLKIAFAESCTGGYLSHLITTIAGSSEYFEGSVIAYSYDLKEKLLGVSSETLNTLGAVSEECVKEMVKGALERLGVDIAVAVSGIAGPGGATPEKPVGTIWMACGNKEDIITAKLAIDRGRLKNIEYAGNSALNLVRKFLITH